MDLSGQRHYRCAPYEHTLWCRTGCLHIDAAVPASIRRDRDGRSGSDQGRLLGHAPSAATILFIDLLWNPDRPHRHKTVVEMANRRLATLHQESQPLLHHKVFPLT